MLKCFFKILLISALFLVIGINYNQLIASASNQVKKERILPKNFRGAWYRTSYYHKTPFKIRVTKNKFWNSKLRKTVYQRDDVALSEAYFVPYKLTGRRVPVNTLIFVNSSGLQLVRRMKIRNHSVLIVFDQQEHFDSLSILSKSKKSKLIKYYMGSNAFGGGINTRMDALKNKKFYKTINPIIKKSFGGAVVKHTVKGTGIEKYRGIKIVYYTMKDESKFFPVNKY